jgi:hypothetical protein
VTEPRGVEMTPSFQRLLGQLADASSSGDKTRLEEIVSTAADDDLDAFLAWSRRRVWIDSEIIAHEERLREIDEHLREQ